MIKLKSGPGDGPIKLGKKKGSGNACPDGEPNCGPNKKKKKIRDKKPLQKEKKYTPDVIKKDIRSLTNTRSTYDSRSEGEKKQFDKDNAKIRKSNKKATRYNDRTDVKSGNTRAQKKAIRTNIKRRKKTTGS